MNKLHKKRKMEHAELRRSTSSRQSAKKSCSASTSKSNLDKRWNHEIVAARRILRKYLQIEWKRKLHANKSSQSKEIGDATKKVKPMKPHKQKFTKKVNLKELDAGITEYVSPNDGFTAVLKSRFSDFIVNEIDLSGKVLRLTDLEVPKVEKATLSEEQVKQIQEELKDIVSEAQWEAMTAMAAVKYTQRLEFQPVLIDVDAVDKTARTRVHEAVKKIFNKRLISTTESVKEKDSKGADKVKKVVKIMAPKLNDRVFSEWPFKKDFVHFLVYKENVDTNTVVTTLADRMKMHPSQVAYCGMKDKRGKTTQRFSIRRREPTQIAGALRMMEGVHIGNFEFNDVGLKLGDLNGNRFRIALRHVTADTDHIEKCLVDLERNGFINYFGLQRFGNAASVPTYAVGEALLKNDFKKAVELIMVPRENEAKDMAAIRKFWWDTRDAAATLTMFKRGKCIERTLMAALAKGNPNDYCSALYQLPRNMLMIYLHAFQSVIFNRVTSRRIKEFGLEIIEGDLVYIGGNKLDLGCELDCDLDESDKCSDTKRKAMVKAVTAEEISNGDYTIRDVVLPLPGHDVTYPNNVVADWYTEMLKEHGLSSEKLRTNRKALSLTGAYRRILVWPQDLKWKICRYDSPDTSLIQSDWDALQGDEINYPSNGIYTGLLLEFSLPTSTYATMMLRELLKQDTSAAKQSDIEQFELEKSKRQQGAPDKAELKDNGTPMEC